MKTVRPLDTRQMPRYVGHLDGDLDIMGITIKQAIIHNAGEEFVVWVDEDGRVRGDVLGNVHRAVFGFAVRRGGVEVTDCLKNAI